MGSVIKFGTDGWRAIIAEDFTFDNVRACGAERRPVLEGEQPRVAGARRRL